MPVPQDFTSVPILDYSLLQTDKPKFLTQLRHAVINIGFFYLSNTPVSLTVIDSVISYLPRLFDLPQEEKDSLSIRNSPYFHGYSCLGAELTKGATDQREYFGFGGPYKSTWAPGDPEYLKHWGEVQWPSEESLPGFRETMETYISQVEDLSFAFSSLLAEALGLPPDALDRFYDSPKKSMQQRCKVAKYPAATSKDAGMGQGVGPHCDSGFMVFLLQASPHKDCLQVQNRRGDWISANPIPGTFVVNFGKALETVTQGAAFAACHRALSPPYGSGPRYSIPLSQSISRHVCVGEHNLELPEDIKALVRAREGVTIDAANFAEYNREPSGLVSLIGCVRSHPEAAQLHYPELFKKYFPNGLPAQAAAY